ncbi:hypothetical protein EVAR_63971_1 [Eumeta japonica]|uniref:Uncharacterized protein n=1 Tax=Eumeta variegata TaxID=151549 RepID=A0A4C1ZI11_EUMVA|nr:hypothetical protein EVAR_63971_1 [Eumeta japonica]
MYRYARALPTYGRAHARYPNNPGDAAHLRGMLTPSVPISSGLSSLKSETSNFGVHLIDSGMSSIREDEPIGMASRKMSYFGAGEVASMTRVNRHTYALGCPFGPSGGPGGRGVLRGHSKGLSALEAKPIGPSTLWRHG